MRVAIVTRQRTRVIAELARAGAHFDEIVCREDPWSRAQALDDTLHAEFAAARGNALALGVLLDEQYAMPNRDAVFTRAAFAGHNEVLRVLAQRRTDLSVDVFLDSVDAATGRGQLDTIEWLFTVVDKVVMGRESNDGIAAVYAAERDFARAKLLDLALSRVLHIRCLRKDDFERAIALLFRLGAPGLVVDLDGVDRKKRARYACYKSAYVVTGTHTKSAVAAARPPCS